MSPFGGCPGPWYTSGMRGQAALLAVLCSASAAHAASPDIRAGIEAFRNFDDTAASGIFHGLLRSRPQPADASRAHMYLGLIAMNEAKPWEAKDEFLQALRIDATLELPLDSSPKARVVFGQAQQQISKESLQPAPTAPLRTESQAPQPVLVESAPSGSSRAPAWVLGGVAVAALATGTIFGVLASNTLSSATQALDVGTSQSLAHQSGTDAWVADVSWAAGGVLAVVSGILFFAEGPSSAPSVSAAASPQGAALVVTGHF